MRWSGEGVWIHWATRDFGVEYENHTSHAGPGQILLYPGGISETEILLAYGGVCFASKMGMLAGNHFITLTSGLENLKTLGNAVLWEGAKIFRSNWLKQTALERFIKVGLCVMRGGQVLLA